MQQEDRIAIVTGAARGIGEGIARRLAEEGAKVATLDLDGAQAERTATDLPTDSNGFATDCAEEDAVAVGVRRVIDHFGTLHVLVNNAGAGRGEAIEPVPEGYTPGFMGLDQEAWDLQLAQNLRTTFLVSKAAIPALEEGGRGAIINIASIAGLGPSVGIPAYGAAKAGVVSLTKSLALDLAPKNIRVNAICPGFLWTRGWEGMATRMQQTNPDYSGLSPREVFLQIVANGVPLGREQTPDDIGAVAAFLAGDGALNITGQIISVDGGITLR
ncbi:MAG TPA: SDR family NAD(P)-dependent oxidoreductase [Dehalococcoidia bacterium]|nr:SDR family NAD(P)-dependent oxidoreductase [Dehalococcoidia bacterium]